MLESGRQCTLTMHAPKSKTELLMKGFFHRRSYRCLTPPLRLPVQWRCQKKDEVTVARPVVNPCPVLILVLPFRCSGMHRRFGEEGRAPPQEEGWDKVHSSGRGGQAHAKSQTGILSAVRLCGFTPFPFPHTFTSVTRGASLMNPPCFMDGCPTPQGAWTSPPLLPAVRL